MQGIEEGQVVQIDRALWTKDERSGGFLLKASPVTECEALSGKDEENVKENLCADAKGLSKEYVGGNSGEGTAKLTSLSRVVHLLDDRWVRKELNENLWEIPWAFVADVRNAKQDAAELSYVGCSVCFAKDCKKHSDAPKLPCYSILVTFADNVCKVEAKCFTRVARELFSEICEHVDSFPEEVIDSQKHNHPFVVRMRIGMEEPYMERPARNFLEVVAAAPLPLTFAPGATIKSKPCAAAGLPDVFLEDCEVNGLGHLQFQERRHGLVRFLAQLQGKPKMESAEGNVGARIQYDAEVLGRGQEKLQLKLLWTVALQDMQPLMRLNPGDLLYVLASAQKNKSTWNVTSFRVVNEKEKDAMFKAFAVRAEQSKCVLDTESADSSATPLKRRSDLISESKDVDMIGTYAE